MTRMAGSVPAISSFLGKGADFGSVGGQAINAAAEEHAQTFANNAHVNNAGLKAQQEVASAGHFADYQKAAGAAQASATMAGGIASAAGSFGKMIGGMGKGGGGLFG